MKSCYNNPKITTRIGFKIGSYQNNMKLLEYQKDRAFVKNTMNKREREQVKMLKEAVYSILCWAIMMAVIWFLLINADLIK